MRTYMLITLRKILGIAIILAAPITLNAEEPETLIFEGHDPVMQWDTTIVLRNGKYYLDGQEMEKLRHPSMPQDGLSLAMKDRVGRPNMYWLVLPRMLDVFVNCEYGQCTYKRSIIGTCCVLQD